MAKGVRAKAIPPEDKIITSGDCSQVIQWYANWFGQNISHAQTLSRGLFASNFEEQDQLVLDGVLAKIESLGMTPLVISGDELFKQADYLWNLALGEVKFGKPAFTQVENLIKESPLLVISNLLTPSSAQQLWYLYHYVFYARALAGKPIVVTTPLNFEEFIMYGAGCDDFEYAGRRLTWEKLVSLINSTLANLAHCKQLQAENLPVMLAPEYKLYRSLQSRHLSVTPQYIQGKHSLDFALINPSAKINLDIECDFTLTQQKERDKSLIDASWQVVRFSFKEISNNLDACVDAVEEIVKSGNKKTSVGRSVRALGLMTKINLPVEDLEQLSVISSSGGPLAVTGGAGTGKSTCIAQRIIYLLNAGVNAERILVLSYSPETIKSIKQMTNKIIEGQAADKVAFYTWSDFGLRILKENVSAIKRKLPLKVESSSQKVLQKLIAKYRKELDQTQLELAGEIDEDTAASMIALYKANLVTAQMVKEQAKNELEQLVAKVYLAYEEQLQKTNKIDKDDMVSLAAQLLGENADLRNQYQKLFEYVIIDEYQDASIACDFLARVLAFPNDNLLLVGNEDEAISDNLGGAQRLLAETSIRIPNTKCHVLRHNWRAHPQITKHAEQFLGHLTSIITDQHRIEKSTVTGWGEAPSQAILGPYEFADQMEEIVWIIGHIEELLRQGRKPEEIAIICRTKEQAIKVEAMLSSRGMIINTASVDFTLLPDEAADVLAFLRLVADPDGPKAKEYFERICHLRSKTVSPKLSATISGCAESFNLSFLKAVEIYAEAAADPFCFELEQLVKIIRAIHHDKTPPSKVIALLKRPQWFGEYYKSLKVPAQANYEPLKMMSQMEDDARIYKTVAEFVKNYSPPSSAQSTHALNEAAINLLSVVEAKGREFQIVFLPMLVEGVFPDAGQFDIDLERRNFYVALTRTRELLYLSFSKQIDERAYAPSSFLAEAALEIVPVVPVVQENIPEVVPEVVPEIVLEVPVPPSEVVLEPAAEQSIEQAGEQSVQPQTASKTQTNEGFSIHEAGDTYAVKAKAEEPAKIEEEVISLAVPEVEPIKIQNQCINCHQLLEPGTRFCGECGTLQEEQEKVAVPQAQNLCKSCASLLEAGAKFCGECGQLQ